MTKALFWTVVLGGSISLVVSGPALAHCGKSPTSVSLTIAGSGDAKGGNFVAANKAAAAFKAALDDMTKAKTKAEMAAARDRALAAIEAQRVAFAAWASGSASGVKAAEANTAKARQAASDVSAYAASHMATMKS